MAEYLRLIRRTHLQTPVHRYTHPDTGRRVTVIGTVHLGEPAYFAGLRAAIDDLTAAGAVVHCEGSRLLACDDPDITVSEQQILTDMRRCHELEKRWITELGWVGQIEGLGYPPQWRVIDLNQLQIIRRVGVETMRQSMQRKTTMLDRLDKRPNGIDVFRLGTAVTLRAGASDRRAVQRRTAEPTDPVLVGDRTTVALGGVFDTDRDTVLVWGAGHVPGLGAGLGTRGFVRRGEPQWHTVARVPSVRSAWWRLIVGGRRRTRGTATSGPGELHTGSRLDRSEN